MPTKRQLVESAITKIVRKVLREKKKKSSIMENTFKADGYMTLTNTSGIEVELDRRGDGLRYRFVGTDDPDTAKIEEAEIETFYPEDDPDWPYDDDDEPRQGFQTSHGEIYYLDQFMRSGY